MCVTQFLQIENKVAVTKRYTVLELHVLCPFGLCFALAKHCQSRSPFRGTCDQQRWINAVAWWLTAMKGNPSHLATMTIQDLKTKTCGNQNTGCATTMPRVPPAVLGTWKT